MIHQLKTIPKYFQQIVAGTKTFEVRKNDRGFQKWDALLLKEWDKGYSGEEILVEVTSVLYDYEFKGVEKGFCIMSINLLMQKK